MKNNLNLAGAHYVPGAKQNDASASYTQKVPHFELYKVMRSEELMCYRHLVRLLMMRRLTLTEATDPSASLSQLDNKHYQRMLEDLREELCISEDRHELEVIAAAQDPIIAAIRRTDFTSPLVKLPSQMSEAEKDGLDPLVLRAIEHNRLDLASCRYGRRASFFDGGVSDIVPPPPPSDGVKVVIGIAGAINDGDPIIDLVYALGAEYRANGTFVMNSKTAGTVRKLKDADGRFLWSDGLAAGEPARLMGYPVLVAEDMPDVAADSMAIAFGDFGAGYTIAERPDLRVLRDPFSAKPHVLFYATKRVGGAVSDFAAIKLLKFGTA